MDERGEGGGKGERGGGVQALGVLPSPRSVHISIPCLDQPNPQCRSSPDLSGLSPSFFLTGQCRLSSAASYMASHIGEGDGEEDGRRAREKQRRFNVSIVTVVIDCRDFLIVSCGFVAKLSGKLYVAAYVFGPKRVKILSDKKLQSLAHLLSK